MEWINERMNEWMSDWNEPNGWNVTSVQVINDDTSRYGNDFAADI